MADQAITALPKKTYSGSSQIASTDYLLGIDSAEGYQMLIQDLGEYIINRATASLAGSTQTLASAISALNSKTYSLSGGTALQANADLNTLGVGNYYSYSTITVQNGPMEQICGIVKVEHSAGTDNAYLRQIYRRYNADYTYERIKNGNTWSNWVKQPTRSEIPVSYPTTQGNNTFVLGVGYRGTMTIVDSVQDRCACYIVFSTGAGAVGYKAIATSSNITLDVSTANKIKVTVTSGTPMVTFTTIIGSVPTKES